jgi:hypothetical protein
MNMGTPRPVPHSLAGLSDPTDSMQTLDNINIDDLLQIGGHTSGFQGFSGFPPIKSAEPLKKSNTVPTPERSFSEMDTLDIDLDGFGDDIDAHLEETLDGVQVGEILPSSLNFNEQEVEIQPGETLGKIADELGLPETNETDLNNLSLHSLDEDLDAWEQSAPAIQEAARQVQQHRDSIDLPEEHSIPDEKRNNLVLVAVTILAIGGIGWLVTSGSSPDGIEDLSKENTLIQAPSIQAPKTLDEKPLIQEGTPEPVEEEVVELEKEDVPEQETPSIEPVEVAPEKKPAPVVAKPVPRASKPVKSSKPKAPKVNSPKKVTKKVTPKKPRTTTLPIPQKPTQKKTNEPKPAAANEWGSDAQTGGWGASSSCAVTIKSNISTAGVFVDGKKVGKVGQSINLDCGSHVIIVKADGYDDSSRKVNLSEDASFTMDLDR